MAILDQEKQTHFLTIIKEQDDIDKIYLDTKDLSEPKYECLIKKRKDVGINSLNDTNSFIESSNTMDDVYGKIEDYNPSKKRKKKMIALMT